MHGIKKWDNSSPPLFNPYIKHGWINVFNWIGWLYIKSNSAQLLSWKDMFKITNIVDSPCYHLTCGLSKGWVKKQGQYKERQPLPDPPPSHAPSPPLPSPHLLFSFFLFLFCFLFTFYFMFYFCFLVFSFFLMLLLFHLQLNQDLSSIAMDICKFY